jgi:hypothetical protein
VLAALTLSDVPIDVLAERLNTTRARSTRLFVRLARNSVGTSEPSVSH